MVVEVVRWFGEVLYAEVVCCGNGNVLVSGDGGYGGCEVVWWSHIYVEIR